MARAWLLGSLLALTSFVPTVAADPVFSGPQPGEALPPLSARAVFGDSAGEEISIVDASTDQPLVLFFVHARTRPAFGLTNAIMKYAATRADDGLQGAVVYLTDDASATSKWMNQVEHYFPKGVRYGVSLEGAEGPGAYGLNRNVTLTVLVANEGKVTHNFALIQPSLQADGPKIAKAIVDVLGGGDVPSVEELGGERYARNNPRAMRGREAEMRQGARDPELTALVRAVIQKDASEEAVKAAAEKVEAYVEKNEAARRQLGQMTTTVVRSGKIENYGTEAAQRKIRAWAQQYGQQSRGRDDKKSE